MSQPIIDFSWSSVMILINIVILYFIMKHFFFEKIHNFMQARQDSVKDALSTAEVVNKKADQKMADYEKKIARIESEGRDIIKDSKQRADERADKIIADANSRASEILQNAEKEIEREKAQALTDMREEISNLAFMAAEQIMQKELQKTGEQEKIVDEIIEEAGKSGWQN
jgi:ATP synthase, F0 subunit b